MPPKRERGPEVVGRQTKDVTVVARVGDDQEHPIDATIAALEGKAPEQSLDVAEPGLRVDGQRPIRT